MSGSSAITPREERFKKFQDLCKEMKSAQNPEAAAQYLARLYNGLTTEITKAEAEITRLHNASVGLSGELQSLKASMLQVFLHNPKLEPC